MQLGSLWRWVESLTFRAIRRGIARALGFFIRLAIAAAAALTLGVGSAWYMIDYGSPLTVEVHGPWRTWPAAARPDADPYTRAHFARLGWLTLSSAEVVTLVASTDSAGQMLDSDCEYEVTGSTFEAGWWSLAVFDGRGGLLDVPAERHVLSRATIVAEPGNRMTIRLATDARPGNWLPTLGGTTMTLVMKLQRVSSTGAAPASVLPVLPAINRVNCR